MFLIPIATVGPLNTESVSVCGPCQHLLDLLWFAEPVRVCRAFLVLEPVAID